MLRAHLSLVVNVVVVAAYLFIFYFYLTLHHPLNCLQLSSNSRTALLDRVIVVIDSLLLELLVELLSGAVIEVSFGTVRNGCCCFCKCCCKQFCLKERRTDFDIILYEDLSHTNTFKLKMKILSPLTTAYLHLLGSCLTLAVLFVASSTVVTDAAYLQPEDYLRRANDELQKEIQLLTNAQWDLASNITPSNEAKVVRRLEFFLFLHFLIFFFLNFFSIHRINNPPDRARKNF